MDPVPSNAKYGCISTDIRSAPVNVGRSPIPANHSPGVRQISGDMGARGITLNNDIRAITCPNASNIANHSMRLEIATDRSPLSAWQVLCKGDVQVEEGPRWHAERLIYNPKHDNEILVPGPIHQRVKQAIAEQTYCG